MKEKNNFLQEELDNVKNLLDKFKKKISELFNYFANKMWGDKYDRDTYYPIASDLYSRNILDNEEMSTIKDIKTKSANMDKESKSRNDDIEL